MKPLEVAQAMEKAFDAGDWQTMAVYLSDDYAFVFSPEMSLSKDQVIFFGNLLLQAFPNRTYDLRDFEENGNQVKAVQNISGDHTGTLDLSFMNMPVIPATGKHVTLPLEHITYFIENDKVIRMEAVAEGAGGLPAILEQIGYSMPG